MRLMHAATRRAHTGRRIGVRFLLCVLALVAGRTAVAQALCTTVPQTILITLPESITVPRDAAVGTVLTPWVSSAAQTDYSRCQVTPTPQGGRPATGTAFLPLSMTSANLRVTGPEGVAYTVWNTNVPGVGIAIGARIWINGCRWWLGWRDFGAPSGVWGTCNANGAVTNGGQVQLALVKTGVITPGTVVGAARIEAATLTAPDRNGPYTYSDDRISFVLNSIAIKIASCSTADVSVRMGSVNQSVFRGVGSTAHPVPFRVMLNACPAGMKAVQYEFIPVTAELGSEHGVLALTSDSTATGIGLELKDHLGEKVRFRTAYTAHAYNSAAGGTYYIDLTAAYRQVANAVTPGTANALLAFTLTYQ